MFKKFYAFLAIVMILAMSLPNVTAYAWSPPTVTANCAPDSTHYSFTITLPSESDYKIQWSWNSNFSGYTSVTMHIGDNPLTVTRGGTTLYVRWASDTGVFGSAAANGTLCHQSHKVTWATSTDCVGWKATYSIDGAPSVVYDSGSWSKPFVLETANPKAFTVPEVPGDTYDYPNSPSVTIYETKDCQKTHTVTWNHTVDCDGWTATYSIDGATPVVYDSGSWTLPYVLETAFPKTFTIPENSGELYDNPNAPKYGINEPSSCQQTHKVIYGSDNSCTGGWDAWYTIDGGDKQIYASGSWTEPFVLESANVPAENIPTNFGELYDNPHKDGFTINESTDCQAVHKVIWDAKADCTGWSATYSIDGGTPVVYDSGVWTNPFVLETANPKAFTITENQGEVYDFPNSPSVTVNEPETCQKTHVVIYGTDNTCTGGWDAWYTIDGGDKQIYASGSWTQPFVLESANVPAEDIPTISGQLYDNPHKDGFVINESADCQSTHKVTWKVNNDCTGWSATYAIDGSSVQYASGTWPNPSYTLESVNVPAYDLTSVETAGQKYDATQVPGVTVNEPQECLVTLKHDHALTPGNNCDGWSVTPTSSDGGVFTPGSGVVLSGTWKDLYGPESATVNGTWNWPDGFSLSDSITINKDSKCIVNLNHNAVINVQVDCKGWSASFSSSDGGIGTPTTPTSGVWTDEFNPEHATVSYSVVWPDGYKTVVSKEVDKPDTCLEHKVAGIEYKKKGCGSSGSTYTFTFPDKGVKQVELTKGPKTIILTKSGDILLSGGTWDGKVVPADGYEIVPSKNALFTIKSTVCTSCTWQPTGRTVWVNYMLKTDPLHYGFWKAPDGSKTGVCSIVTFDGNPPTALDQNRLCGCGMPPDFVWRTDSQVKLYEVKNSCTGEIRLWDGWEFVTPFGGYNPKQKFCTTAQCPPRSAP